MMLFIILLNISQRKYPRTERKRKATILIAVDFLVVYSLVAISSIYALPSWVGWACLVLGIAAIIIFRRSMWPFRLHCSQCGKRLEYSRVIGYDENLCQECYWASHPEEKEREEARTRSPEEILEQRFTSADHVDDIPWNEWEPTERCVLTYVIDGSRILLILKKRGLGEGYINAPGGHIELEETKTEAAIRETEEETGLRISDPEERGVLHFQFKDGMRMLGYVFFAHKWEGELIDECEETKPFWTEIDSLDYSVMWEDDRLWLPLALEGRRFSGYFIFDGRTMIDSRVTEEEEEPSLYNEDTE